MTGKNRYMFIENIVKVPRISVSWEKWTIKKKHEL